MPRDGHSVAGIIHPISPAQGPCMRLKLVTAISGTALRTHATCTGHRMEILEGPWPERVLVLQVSGVESPGTCSSVTGGGVDALDPVYLCTFVVRYSKSNYPEIFRKYTEKAKR